MSTNSKHSSIVENFDLNKPPTVVSLKDMPTSQIMEYLRTCRNEKSLIYKHFEPSKMENQKIGLINRLIQKAETLDDYIVVGKQLIKSSLVPKKLTDGSSTPELDIMLIIDHGTSIGLSWSESLSGLIPAPDGRFIMRGDTALALVRAWALQTDTPLDMTVEHINEGKPDYVCVISGFEGKSSFGLADAIRAGLYDPEGVVKSYYKKYPKRQCYYRALGFFLRDNYSHVLKNIIIEEEYRDFAGVGEEEIDTTGKVFKFPDAEEKTKKTKGITEKIARKQEASEKKSEKEYVKYVWVHDTNDNEICQTVNCTPLPDGLTFLENALENDERTPQEIYDKHFIGKDDVIDEEPIPPQTTLTYALVEKETLGFKVKELMDYVAEKLPEAVEAIERIPGSRKTVGKIMPVIEAVIDDSVDGYFKSRYPEEEVAPAPKAPEPKKEEVVKTETKEEEKEEAPETQSGDDLTSNILGIEVDEILPSEERNFKHANKIGLGMAKGGVYDLVEAAMEQMDYEDVEEFILSAPASEIHNLINEANSKQ